MAATIGYSERSGAPVLHQMWWAMLLRGVAILVFGLLAFFWAKGALASLAMLFGVYAVVDGVLSIVGAMRGGGLGARPGMALAGVVSVVAGLAALLMPNLTAPTLVLIIGAWAIASGLLEFAAALKLRQVMERDWSLVAVGGFSIAMGLILVLNPQLDLWTMVRVLAPWAVITALLMFVLARRFNRGFRP